MPITRRKLLAFFPIAAAAKLFGCGGQCAGGVEAEISVNHDHYVTVPAADLESTGTRAYSLRGNSQHEHSLRLEKTHFADLRSGLTVIVMSSSNGHSHRVTLKICG